VVCLASVLFLGAGAAHAATPKLPPLLARWPKTLQIGLSESPGAIFKPLGFRYQYLAGGVNTGQGWSTWNPNGSFVTRYENETWAAGQIPVFTYYQLLQSKPAAGSDELHKDLSNLQNPQTMAVYWQDVRLLFARAKSTKTVVVHVEPDLWGYLEQAGDVSLARNFAHTWITLRNKLAPNVLLAYHMSGWGTKHDIVYEDPPDATVRAYAAQSAAFYTSLHAKFDIAFEDFSDRDAGFYEKVEGNPNTWFTPADFHRHLLYAQTFVKLAGVRMVAWQIPLGNTVSPVENDTWDHYKDNRVQWLLGAGSRVRLRAYVNAGFAGFMFGAGADGNTTADTDGGYFKTQARAYYRARPLPLPAPSAP
jgi:hypothetical protein